jgi:hypothetical protein
MGERHICSDPNCGREIEVKNPSRVSAGSSSEREGVSEGSGSGRGLRAAESQGISTQGDFGSQGAAGEGAFGTSGESSATMQGRYGSTVSHRSSERASNGNFTCCCGSPMRRASQASGARA